MLLGTATGSGEAPKSLEARIDYLTAYWSEEDSGKFPEALFNQLLSEEQSNGQDFQHRSGHGIEWYGAGQHFYGVRGDERFVRLSGAAAGRSWRPFSRSASHVSRIDGAVDCCYDRPAPSLAGRTFRQLERSGTGRRGARKRSFIVDERGAETLTLGSRQSDTYLRLYDSGVVHELASVGCRWRFETEWKGDRAKRLVPLLLSYPSECAGIAANVRQSYTKNGVEVPWIDDTQALEHTTEIRTSDKERRLKWMRSQVAPSVARMAQAGYLEDVWSALGFETLIGPFPKPE